MNIPQSTLQLTEDDILTYNLLEEIIPPGVLFPSRFCAVSVLARFENLELNPHYDPYRGIGFVDSSKSYLCVSDAFELEAKKALLEAKAKAPIQLQLQEGQGPSSGGPSRNRRIGICEFNCICGPFPRMTDKQIMSMFGPNGGMQVNVGIKRTYPLRIYSDGSLAPFIIGIAGGTASGKTTLCKRIMDFLGQSDLVEQHRRVISLSQDSFYRELSPSEIEMANKGEFNFDRPAALDVDLMIKVIKDIAAGKETEVPFYDFTTNSRIGSTKIHGHADVILFEGVLALAFEELNSLYHLKIFVDADSDARLARRINRDLKHRGRDIDHIIHQYLNSVKPAFDNYCLPSKAHADIVVPRGADNIIAITMVSQHIKELLESRLHAKIQDVDKDESVDEKLAKYRKFLGHRDCCDICSRKGCH